MRKSQRKNKAYFFLLMIGIVAVFTLLYRLQPSSSHAQAALDESRISYLSVPIVAEDTLSGIAKEYYSDEFGSLRNYMKEIKKYNSLTTDTIYAGNYLIVPVYNYSNET